MGLWFRVYTDLPNCVKLRRLPPDVQLAYVWFLCLHKEGELVGKPVADIAWRLRLTEAETERYIVALQAAKCLADDRTPTGWRERQYKSDDATTRWREWRDKRHANNGTEQPSNVGQTLDQRTTREEQSRAETEKNDGVPSTTEPEVPAPSRNGISFDYDAGKLLGVTDTDRTEWSSAFPAVAVDNELLRAEQWLKDNPTKRKKHVRRFLTNWLARCQERGGTSPTFFDRKPARADTGEPNI